MEQTFAVNRDRCLFLTVQALFFPTFARSAAPKIAIVASQMGSLDPQHRRQLHLPRLQGRGGEPGAEPGNRSETAGDRGGRLSPRLGQDRHGRRRGGDRDGGGGHGALWPLRCADARFHGLFRRPGMVSRTPIERGFAACGGDPPGGRCPPPDPPAVFAER